MRMRRLPACPAHWPRAADLARAAMVKIAFTYFITRSCRHPERFHCSRWVSLPDVLIARNLVGYALTDPSDPRSAGPYTDPLHRRVGHRHGRQRGHVAAGLRPARRWSAYGVGRGLGVRRDRQLLP